MYSTHTSALDQLLLIDSLLANRHRTISTRERENSAHIHLYRIGNDWAAFDRSAFLAEQQLCLREEPEILELTSSPFPLVMHILTDTHLRLLCKDKYQNYRTKEHLPLPCSTIDLTAYHAWYNNLML